MATAYQEDTPLAFIYCIFRDKDESYESYYF